MYIQTRSKLELNPRKLKNAPDHLMVRLSVYLPLTKRYVHVSTGVCILPYFWDDYLKKVNVTHPEHKPLNAKIEKFQKNMDMAIFNVHSKGVELNRENLMTEYRILLGNKPIKNSFTKFFKREIEEMEVSDGTMILYERFYDMLEKWNPDIQFNEIGFDFVLKFNTFLKKKYNNKNTIAKYHKMMKTIIIAAYKKGHIGLKDLESFKMFKQNDISGDRQPLYPPELKKMEELKLNGGTLELVHDMFLFGCYTGLRVGDIQSLTRSDLIEENGNYTVNKIMQKLKSDRRRIVLPLHKLFNGKPQVILEKYLGEREKVFPNVSKFTISTRMKQLFEMIGLDNSYVFHCSRHTFLTNLAMKTGNQYLVMQYGGITSTMTVKKYIHLAEKYMNSSLDNINWD